jgi:hypothetical protein
MWYSFHSPPLSLVPRNGRQARNGALVIHGNETWGRYMPTCELLKSLENIDNKIDKSLIWSPTTLKTWWIPTQALSAAPLFLVRSCSPNSYNCPTLEPTTNQYFYQQFTTLQRLEMCRLLDLDSDSKTNPTSPMLRSCMLLVHVHVGCISSVSSTDLHGASIARLRQLKYKKCWDSNKGTNC